MLECIANVVFATITNSYFKILIYITSHMNKNMTHVKQESNEIFCKEEIKIKQHYDKKLMLNKLKIIKKFIYIYTYWASNSRKFFF